MNEKKWVLKDISQEKAERISKAFNISMLTAKIIIGRGLEFDEEINLFLQPELSRLHDPFLLKDMEKAVNRILFAIKNNEKILIYGDYDVDGITSVSILYDFLMKQNYIPMCYIPRRIEDGYGLSETSLPKILKSKATLVITVDCGISSVDEVDFLNENDIDVIIVDHHECSEILPNAYAIIDPCQIDCKYPYKYLAGVGVVFKLICALAKVAGIDESIVQDYLDLTAIGTISDVVNLTDENRIIAKKGLERISHSKNIGLRVLLDECGMKDKYINALSIAYTIAPRLNAAGRMGEAIRGVKLLLTKYESVAQSIAIDLINENLKRQSIEHDILDEAIKIIENNANFKDIKVIVVKGDNWHHGMLGIVASKITDRYYKPCIIISCDDKCGKASARSIIGFDIFKALTQTKDYLIKYGGHKMAAGLTLTINDDNIDAFSKAINLYADEVIDEDIFISNISIDCEVDIADLTINTLDELEVIGPFGAANPIPVICVRNIKVEQLLTMGNGKHIRIVAGYKNKSIEIIGFNMVNVLQKIKCGDLIDVIGVPEINQWAGKRKVQLNLKDLKLSVNE